MSHSMSTWHAQSCCPRQRHVRPAASPPSGRGGLGPLMALTVHTVPLARLFCVASVNEDSGKPQARVCTSAGRPRARLVPHSHGRVHHLLCLVHVRPAVRCGGVSRGAAWGCVLTCFWRFAVQVKNCLELQPGALNELSLPGLGNFCFPVRVPDARPATARRLLACAEPVFRALPTVGAATGRLLCARRPAPALRCGTYHSCTCWGQPPPGGGQGLLGNRVCRRCRTPFSHAWAGVCGAVEPCGEGDLPGG